MEQQEIFKVVQDSVDSLFRSELIRNKICLSNETILLGKGSELDSVSFITLFSEIEDRLSAITGIEIFIDFNKLHDFNKDKFQLNVVTLVDFINSLLNTAG
jgi:acyl carrier protein